MDDKPVASFEYFFVGDCNRFAYKTAVFVAENPSCKTTNPTLIWGEPGQGKTHLLKAMAATMLEKHPEMRVIYVTGEEFTNEFISTVRYRNYSEFREKYRSADCLLLDDIQFFKHKEGIQCELYNTVQALLESGKQIVFSSKIMPNALDSVIQDGLVNLLLSGVVIGIHSPDYETRKTIAKKISDSENLSLTDEVIDIVCDNETYNVKRLIDAMNIIVKYCKSVATEPADVKIVLWLLYPNGGCFVRKKMTAGRIINLVAWYFDTTRKQILNGSNKPSENPARLAAVLLCREYLPPSDKIFSKFGKTVSEAKIVFFKRENHQFCSDLDTISHILKCWQFGIRMNP